MTIEQSKIALVLSGGGIRAMVFHLGVLKFLAEKNSFERVSRISTVSGGSLIVGLIYQEASLKWPSSATFINTVYPTLKQKLCHRSMFLGAFRRLLNPLNFRFILSRANLLALTLKKEWGINSCLGDLPSNPEWSINGTTAESGKRFRFKRANFGDYMTGYANSQSFPLSNALAVSAAFPGGFGPLAIKTSDYTWVKREHWNDSELAKPINLNFKNLHVYDGGVYDNLGLEPYFDSGKNESKIDGAIIVSDAGAPLTQGFNWSALNPWRLKRVTDIMSDQSRSLRVRSFTSFIVNNNPGAYLYIAELPESDGSKFSSTFPTTLRKLSLIEFDILSNHGYAVAQDYFTKHGLT
jgi:NTE family protein